MGVKADSVGGKVAWLRAVVVVALVGSTSSLLAVRPVTAAEVAPIPVFTFTGLGAGGGYSGGTSLAGPDGIVGTADDDDPLPGSSWGGQIQGPVEAGETTVATSTWCIDLTTGIGVGNETDLGAWADALAVALPGGRTNTLTAPNLDRIARIVANNFPNDDTLVPLAGTDNDKALAIQWAIWHYANGYDPGVALASINMGSFGIYGTTPGTVASNYALILDAVETGVYPDSDEPVLPYLEITPPTPSEGIAGGTPAGPFTIRTNAGIDVTATPDGDAVVVDALGTPLAGPFADGDELYLAKPTTGPASITISATMAIPVGATYVTGDVQRLMNATEVFGAFQADAMATFADAPVFDLALRKTLAGGQSPTVRAGDEATFTIEVFNQGEAPATDIEIVDRLPAGTVLSDGAWADGGDGTASITIAGPLAPGSSTTVDITVLVPADAGPGTRVNTAEIAAAHDDQGQPGIDVDSTPDDDLDNDALVDDVIDSDPNGDPADEDDHDIAEITVLAFDLALRKTTTADLVAPGDLVPFEIRVFNQGDIPARDVVITDAPPDGLTFDAADNPGWALVDGRPTTTLAGPIAPGSDAAVTIHLEVRASPEDGAYVNTAEISAATDDLGIERTDVDSTPDTDLDNDALVDDVIDSSPDGDPADEDDHDIAEVQVFDLALRKTTTAGIVQVGDDVTFTIEVFNQGDVSAEDIVVTDHLPDELAFDPVANPGWGLVDGNPTTVIAGPLAPGASVQVDIVLEVTATADRIDNLAEISDAAGPQGVEVTDIDSTPNVDPFDDVLVDNVIDNTGDDEDDHDIASIGAPVFDLALRKALAAGQADTVWPGEEVRFSIEVFNQGAQAATDIVVIDSPRDGLTFDAADNPGWTSVGGQPTTTIAGPLAPGASTTVEIVLHVAADAAPGPIANLAEIGGATDETGRPAVDVDSVPDGDPDDDALVDDVIDSDPDGDPADEDDHDIAEITVPAFDLALRKTLAAGQLDTVYRGDDVRFTIEVFNQGTVDATQIVVVDTIPPGMTFDAADNPGWTAVGDQVTTTVAGPLAPGASTELDLVLTAVANRGVLVNRAEIAAATDGDGTERSDVDSTPDDDPDNDALVDDVIDSSPDGDPADEDDHDIAEVTVEVFDLALRKTLAAGQAATVSPGDVVAFTIEVFNQGTQAAYDIEVRDSIPEGLLFDQGRNPGWSGGTSVTTVIAGPIQPGASASVTIRLTVADDAPASVTNFAEIRRADDEAGRTPRDEDSVGDDDDANDPIVDDEIDNANGDEDDSDIQTISIVEAGDEILRTGTGTGTGALARTGTGLAPITLVGATLVLAGLLLLRRHSTLRSTP